MRLLCIGDVALTDPANACDGRLGRPNGVPDEGNRVLFNWELPVGAVPNPLPRSSGKRLLAAPDSVRAVRAWSPGFASMATNHILDAGEEGLAATMKSLARAGFTVVGAGNSKEEISMPLTWETPEGRLAIVNWVFPETHPDWGAVPGANCWPGSEVARAIVASLKRSADWVLAVVHWSDELFPYPRPEDRGVARALAAAGADVIVGHHPHVVRGMEFLGACPVFYSLGNFYFEDVPDGSSGWVVRAAPRNREALGIEVSFGRGQAPACKPVSFWQNRGGTSLDRSERAARRMEQVSRPLSHASQSGYPRWYADASGSFLSVGLSLAIWSVEQPPDAAPSPTPVV